MSFIQLYYNSLDKPPDLKTYILDDYRLLAGLRLAREQKTTLRDFALRVANYNQIPPYLYTLDNQIAALEWQTSDRYLTIVTMPTGRYHLMIGPLTVSLPDWETELAIALPNLIDPRGI